MSGRDGRLGVGVVGAGRVGPVLAAALAAAGHALVGISAGTDDERDRVEALLPGAPVLDVPAIVERSELVVLAVPDDQLPELVSGLAILGAWQPGQLVLHTAARYGTVVLDPARAAGAIPLAVHPALAFTGTSVDLARLRDAWCAVTAPAPVLPIAQALVVEMGAEPVVIAEGDRAAYADAVGAVADFSGALIGQSVAALRAIGVDEPGRLLGGVVRSAVENALQSGGADGTGDGADRLIR
ncbi:DUF2520 domain-containing protein [Microcella frigidaquae]|uniref:Putative short-subunit dehydrogenase-like oxidoreductase (DUF2520 family) n=1 Tax=Microcella frigidaquae TaxID=424758 RepID=A0A840XIT4_9MICO|nr:putative short-subunit dehydrogenase-like oxidoreductase (DUF2520 family) [Microcella frigidaquae]NHN44439.1 DUF2520 domain-containing protein [Microcella frigidaquae]